MKPRPTVSVLMKLQRAVSAQHAVSSFLVRPRVPISAVVFKPWVLASVLLTACLALLAAPIAALAAPANLTKIADGGVVAVQDPGGVRTGFAFGNTNLVLAGAPADAAVHLITAHGISAVGDAASRDGELVAVRAPALHLLALRRSSLRELRPGTLAFLLGAPLGYEGEQIRAVRLPAIRLRSRRATVIPGQLPKSFQGAPVVTPGGRVIGAVAAVGASSWTLLSRARLSALLTAAKPSGGEGVPIVSILVGTLVALALIVGLIAIRTQRRRERAASAPVVVHQRRVSDLPPRPIGDPTQHSTQPLVRRRGPEVDGDEDFDIVLKSQEDK
jgi:hypothetical protein